MFNLLMFLVEHSALRCFPLDAHNRHVDGHDYFYAVSEILESAREAIFILVRSIVIAAFRASSLMPSYLIIGLVAHS